MKNKRKKDISDNSDSDKNDFTPLLKTSVHSEKSSKSKNSSKKKSDNNSGSKFNNNSELEMSKAGVEEKEVSENEFMSDDASKKTTDQEFRKTNSCNDNSASVKSIFNVDELTSDDEIFTFQCPDDYIKQNLCNKTINFTKPKQIITLNDKMFTAELLDCDQKFITLAIPKKASGGSLVKMPLMGHIVIQKVVKVLPDKSKEDDIDEDKKQRVIFPNNLKVRHPLLGLEWKAHIDLANEAIKKGYSLKRKYKKKKKEESVKTKEAEVINFKEEHSDSQIIVKKKKKRKKYDA